MKSRRSAYVPFGVRPRPGVRAFVAGVLSTLLIVSLDTAGAFVGVERSASDARTWLFQRHMPPPRQDVAFVLIDDATLTTAAADERVGAWPWPRTVLAGVIDEVSRAGPGVVLIDVLFPERQRVTGEPIGPDGSWVTVDHDAALGDAIGRAGNVILPVQIDEPLKRVRLFPIEPLRAAAAGEAFVDFTPDPDGRLRHLTIATEADYRVITSASLAVACAVWGVDPATLRLYGGHVVSERADGSIVDTLRLPQRLIVPWFGGERWETTFGGVEDHATAAASSAFVPMNVALEAWRLREALNANAERARRPLETTLLETGGEAALLAYYDENPDFESIVQDVLRLRPDDGATTRVLVEALRVHEELSARLREREATLRERLGGRAVLVGWAATGAVADVVPTPLHARLPGVVAHGVAVSGLLNGEVWRNAPRGTSAGLTLALGALTSLAASAWRPGVAATLAVALLLAYVGVNAAWWFDAEDVLVGLSGPTAAIGVAWSGVTLVRVGEEAVGRARVTKRFRAYVDPRLVDYVTAHPEREVFAGEVREMTVVFTDLAGFTSMISRLGGDVVPILNDYLAAMTPIVREHNGVVNKFLGDGIMCFFGAPESSDPPGRHAADALACVLAMRERLAAFNREQAERGRPTLAMRAGVSTGDMVVGDAGGAERCDYTVLGDAVNLAARLESANKQLGTDLLATVRTVELAGTVVGRDRYAIRRVGRVRVVGRPEGAAVVHVVGYAQHLDAQTSGLLAASSDATEALARGDAMGVLSAAERLERLGDATTLATLYRRTVAGWDGSAERDPTLHLQEK